MSLSAVNRARIKQAIKTAIAGVASLYAAKLCRLPEDYWATISALIVMQSNFGATVNASWTRLAGTAVGALVGGVFVAVLGVNVLAFGVAVAIAFYLCSILKLADSQRLATVTVAIVMLIGRLNSSWIIAVHRFLEVSIGILVALLISVVLWPSGARVILRKGIAEVLTNLEAMYQAVSRSYRTGAAVETDELRLRLDETLRRNQGLLQHSVYERMVSPEHHELLALLMDHVDRIFQAVVALEMSTRDSTVDSYFRNFEEELEQLETRISMAFEWLGASAIAWKRGREWPDLAPVVAAVDEKAALLRKSGTSRSYELEEILRFYSFLLGSKNLVRELDLARALLTANTAGKSIH
jgi:uncharacterized membrane protein YccC